MIRLFNMDSNDFHEYSEIKNAIIVTDPPFNIGYHYREYKDKMKEDEYYQMLLKIIGDRPSVIIHYPENICRLAHEMNEMPKRIVSWVYNSNTAKQHRDIAFFRVEPDFRKVRQPYKNPKDKRIQQRIQNGSGGGRLYDWWNVNQVKNVCKDKTSHPCQMPLTVMENIIGILPRDVTIIDPFMGSGTTALACIKYGVDFIGIEKDEEYYKIAERRINECLDAMIAEKKQ